MTIDAVAPAEVGQDRRTADPMDRAVDPTATDQGVVGGIDDDVGGHGRDVALAEDDPALPHPQLVHGGP